MPISLNNSNISVTYNTGSNYIIENVKSDLYIRGTTSGNLSAEPTATPTLTTNLAVFTHSGGTENQTPHSIYFPINTTCDILIVGGGGAGAGTIGGGGGAGSLIFAKNATLNGTYTINVGKGGIGGLAGQGTKGNSSSISKDGINITAEGGGASGRTDGNQNGGSGGGGDYWEGNQTRGTSTSYTSTAFGATIVKYGNNGANAYTPSPFNGGGGGGAGGSALIATSTNLFSNGGSGLHQVIIGGETINFATIFGINTSFVGGVLSNGNLYYAGGGGAGGNESSLGGTGGIGGGGNGGPGALGTRPDLKTNGSNGLLNTGGGGGGGGNHDTTGGNGGSGIVIIRVISPTTNNHLFFNYKSPPNVYTLTFPTITLATINNSSDKLLNGSYTVTIGTTQSTIQPTQNQYLQDRLYFTSNLAISYHILNPIKTTEGAQWTYSSNNPNVYHLGSVGIGTTSPEYSLDVRGFIYSSSGGYTSSALTKWSVLSDRRIKENIVKASYDKCLENVKNIELYNFNFKDNYVNTNDRHQLGFIAQEVQQIYPKAVEVSRMIMNLEEKIDDLLTLNTTQIDYTLYGAVKCLIQKLENIKIKMEQIKTVYNITT